MNYNRIQKANPIARRLFITVYKANPALVDDAFFGFGTVGKHFGIFRKTKKRCKYICCGNPRKYFGRKTRQEKIADMDFKWQKSEMNTGKWLKYYSEKRISRKRNKEWLQSIK